jgi:hypothetical protein
MRACTFFDLAFLSSDLGPTTFTAVDSFDSYVAALNLNGQTGGTGWGLPYVGLGVSYMGDLFADYAGDSDLDGQNGNADFSDWSTAWVAHSLDDAIEDFESYAVNDPLSGLNGGTGWDGAFVSHT